MDDKWIVRGRQVSSEDVTAIRNLIKEYFPNGRNYISRRLAHYWQWYQANGQPKDMACRYILLFLEQQKVIELPPRLRSANNDKKKVKELRLKEEPLGGTVKDHLLLRLNLLNKDKEYKLWNRIVQSYHYQGHRIIVGKYLKYIAYINDNPVACLRLCGIVNNIRFLILPWIRIKYLASYLLGLSAKRVPQDWQKRYGHPIYLLETFIEKEKFTGACYKAANWIYLGQTKGSAKRGSSHRYHGNIKKIFVYPLVKDFRDKLKNNG